jgi:hypothetical protein
MSALLSRLFTSIFEVANRNLHPEEQPEPVEVVQPGKQYSVLY